MYGALIVIALVGLVLPIMLLLAALVFDAVVVVGALYGTWHDRLAPRLWGFASHFATPHSARRSLVRPLAHR